MRISNTSFRAGLLGAAAVAVLGFASTGPAHAGAIGISLIDVKSLYAVDGTGTRLNSGAGGNITIHSGGILQTTAIANLNGTMDMSSDLATWGGTADASRVCVGDCPAFPENNWTPGAQTGPVTSTFSHADAYMDGDVFANSGLGLVDSTRADIYLDGPNNSGISESEGIGGTEFTFTALADVMDGQFRISTYDLIYAYLDDTSGLTISNVTSSGSWNLQILDLTDPNAPVNVFDWQAINTSQSRTSDGMAEFEFDTAAGCDETGGADAAGFVYDAGTGLCYAESPEFDLIAGTRYSISIGHSTTTRANLIPEPMSLALLGGGLLGLGVLRRRQSKKA